MPKFATGEGVINVGGVLKSKFEKKKDDDLIDRVNYFWSPSLLAFFVLLTSSKLYFGDPLTCWVPKNYPSSWEKFSENYCFIENTYYVALDEESFPRTVVEREERELIYYQWVPIILCCQLVLFLLPKTIWSSFNWRTGLTVNNLVAASKPTQKVKVTAGPKCQTTWVPRESDVENFMTALIKYSKEKLVGDKSGLFGAKHGLLSYIRVPSALKGTYVTNFYLLFKALNLANTIFQLYVISQLLGSEYTLFGFGLLWDLYRGASWKSSGQFPRVSYCDVTSREIGSNVQRHTFQCVLTINFFNEKIFIIVWFWLFFLAIANAVNLVEWSILSYSKKATKSFIAKHLAFRELLVTDHELESFIQKMIYTDISCLLRLISYNAGDFETSLIIEAIFKKYRENEEDKKKLATDGGIKVYY